MSCNDDHNPAEPCEHWNCFVLNTKLFRQTFRAAYGKLMQEGHTVILRSDKIGVCPMLMAQTICGTYGLDVNEAQIVMNMPHGMAYANTASGEGVIYMREDL